MKRPFCLLILYAVLFATDLLAQQLTATQSAADQSDTAALLQKIRDLEDRVTALEGQVRQLKSQPAATAPAAQPSATPRGQAPSGARVHGARAQSRAPSCGSCCARCNSGRGRWQRRQSAESGYEHDWRFHRHRWTQSIESIAILRDARIGVGGASDH